MRSKTSALGVSKRWFTFIELVVVITIIILISSTGVIYFFKQVSSLKIASDIGKIIDIVDNLDSQVDSKKILDYEIFINNNSLWFTWSINNLWLDNYQNLNMDFETWTWTISSNSWTILKIYSWIKFQEEKIIDSSWKYSYSFLRKYNSKILAYYSWSTLNNIFINYFSPDNLIINNENKLELTWINTKSDKTWNNYNNIIIQNINWKKSIIPNWWSWINKVYLFFEREWVEKFIEIKK